MTAPRARGPGGPDLPTGAVADGLQQVVDALAARLGRSVAVDDGRGRLVAVSRHFGDEDDMRVHALIQRESDPRVMAHFRAHGIYDWRAPGRTPAAPDFGFKARVVCPARAHGIPFGHLFLIDDGVQEWEVDLAAAAAAEVGLLMYRRLVIHEQDGRRRGELVRDLVAPAAATRALARTALGAELGVEGTAPVVTLVVDVAEAGHETDVCESGLAAGVERAARDHGISRPLLSVVATRAVLVLTGEATMTGTPRSVATQAVAEAARLCRSRVVAGLGRSGVGTDATVDSYDVALLTVRAATMLPALGDIVGEDDLGVFAVLLRLPDDELRPSLYPGPLRNLLAHESGPGLAETLEVYLDEGCEATRTAARLQIHRSTLYYRLGRIESLSGVSMQDGNGRLALHMGTKLRRIVEARSGGRT
ncbi:CdaR family transcriptional regulator [Pseudonocardia sp. ICBG601]|uniref:PucR family transcriptional regulator n=1 Tax=Pseudonocardia sp. ICBG601 TaxID=2846759 RepID=UPI001CF6C338|nr:helix-turn-helix domain-containing protein [Pseudonocardia sp. ICBG601]